MSFYRFLLASAAALVIATPVFADDAAPAAATTEGTAATQSNDTANAASATEQTKINLNTASAKDLMKVQGLNAAKARAIVAYRKKHGNFTTTDELANVKGFKKLNPETLKSITEQLTIQ